MAVKAFATVNQVYLAGPDNAPELYAEVKISAYDGQYSQTSTPVLGPIAEEDWPTINIAIRNAVRTYANSQWGITFGLLDTVALFGAASLL